MPWWRGGCGEEIGANMAETDKAGTRGKKIFVVSQHQLLAVVLRNVRTPLNDVKLFVSQLFSRHIVPPIATPGSRRAGQ